MPRQTEKQTEPVVARRIHTKQIRVRPDRKQKSKYHQVCPLSWTAKMPLSNTEEKDGSDDDANKYNKEEGFVDMWNDSFHPLFTDLQGEDWEQSWGVTTKWRMKTKVSMIRKKKRKKRRNCLGKQRRK